MTPVLIRWNMFPSKERKLQENGGTWRMSIGRAPSAAFEFVAKSARSTIQPDRASCLVGEDGFDGLLCMAKQLG